MGGLGAHPAKVTGAVDDARSEVVMPDTVHNGAPGERIVFGRDPVGESGATGTFIVRVRNRKAHANGTGRCFLHR